MKAHSYFNVLYDSMCMVTPQASKMKNKRKAQCSATQMAQNDKVSQSIVIATTFTLIGIALCSRKFDMYGPNLG